MSKFNALTAAVAAIAIAAALLGGGWHSQAYADDPAPAASRASQSSTDASQSLRRYTLQLLHILSAPDANQWQRYRHAIPHCADAPTYLDEINAGNDVSRLDATLVALTKDLCADLDRRLDDARTVGLLLNEPESMNGYTLIVGRFNNYIHLIDHLGRIVHSWRFEQWLPHAKLLDNGNLLVMTRQDSGRRSSVAEVDPDGSIVWIYTHSERLHHDFLKMPNGNVLMLARGIKTRQEAVDAGANPAIVPDEGMEYDYLIEMRPAGSEGGDIVWEWSALDYIVQDFDPSKPNYGDPSEHPELIDINFLVETPYISRQSAAWDWLHINGIDYNPELDQIALSPRQYSELWIIDHSVATEEAAARSNANPDNTPPRMNVLNNKPSGSSGKGGALLYRWGNPRAYGHGTHADQRLFWQHHTQWIAPGLPGAGNILVFNNGYELVEDPPLRSSIEEIAPPMDGYAYRRAPGAAYPPAEPAWTYTAQTPQDFYSSIMGCVQRLPNGNTLICDSTSGVVFQVSPDGKQVWKYVYPMAGGTPLKQGEEPSISQTLGQDYLLNNNIYRAYWYAPDHPGLQKYDLAPGDTIEIYE